MKNRQNIDIEYEGDNSPVKGFGTPVAGCNVVRLALNDDQTVTLTRKQIIDIAQSADIPLDEKELEDYLHYNAEELSDEFEITQKSNGEVSWL